MNKNPLLIKSFISGKIPLMKGKSSELYGRYLSDKKFIKIGNSETETLSAFTLNSNYILSDVSTGRGLPTAKLVFDQVDTNSSKFFSEDEWIALGLVLRAYKEIENINLMHLYNCLYSSEKNKIRGFVVIGRTYTLYSSTQLPVKLTLSDRVTNESESYTLKYLSKNNPLVICIPDPEKSGKGIERIINLDLEFTDQSLPRCYLVEGTYKGLSVDYINIKGPGSVNKASDSGEIRLVPEDLGVGEYSDKLVEFVAGNLVTPLSDPRLLSLVGSKLPGTGSSIWENAKLNTPGLYNQDGYLDRRSKV